MGNMTMDEDAYISEIAPGLLEKDRAYEANLLANMTMDEADRIVEIVAEAILQKKDDDGRIHHSNFQSFEQITLAFKMRIAHEYYTLGFHRFKQHFVFEDGAHLYASIYARILPRAFNSAYSEIMAFAAFCKSLGPSVDYQRVLGCRDSENYWETIYKQLGLEYTQKATFVRSRWRRLPKDKLISPATKLPECVSSLLLVGCGCWFVDLTQVAAKTDSEYYIYLAAGICGIGMLIGGLALLATVFKSAYHLHSVSMLKDRLREI